VNETVAKGAAQIIVTTTAAAVGAATTGGSAQGAAVGMGVDANNRQLHISTYERLKKGCSGSSSSECQTVNRLGGVRSGMPEDDPQISASKVVSNFDANGKVVSYTLVDRKTNQPTMIMEPLEFVVFRNAPAGTQALMQLSPQYALDFASAGLYSAAGDNGRAIEHVVAGVTSRDYVRDVGLGVAGAAVSAVTAARSATTVIANDAKVGVNSVGRTFGGQSIDELMQAAAVGERGNLSVAGRALQKHGSHDGSAFPIAQGNPAAINEQAQQVVNEILNNPATIATQRNTGRFGQVTDIVAPDGRGLRYDTSGKLIGFLEPPKK
jgi:hypothetical protein